MMDWLFTIFPSCFYSLTFFSFLLFGSCTFVLYRSFLETFSEVVVVMSAEDGRLNIYQSLLPFSELEEIVTDLFTRLEDSCHTTATSVMIQDTTATSLTI